MKAMLSNHRLAQGLVSAALTALLLIPSSARAGVTFITHGLNGNVDGWVASMASQIPSYPRFLGTNYTCYHAYFYLSGGYYYLTAIRVAGAQPTATASGEIIVKFDWSNLADGISFDTFQVASAAAPALLSTNFIPELGGHALAEFPLHLIGHSRGGSLVCEISRLLGSNGVWVDHLTTLDPHPLNNDGFFDFPLLDVDAPARTYANVLFHDNYWQDLNVLAYGEPVPGAFVRKLYTLDGGYSTAFASHADVHLWYHGTLALATPATDTEATITAAERATWWAPYEANGVRAGFYYSLIGHGDRLSTDQPLGPGSPAICDGYNQNWDLGAGLAANRTPLSSNNGIWPSLIQVHRTQTNSVVQGQATPVKFFYQWAHPNAGLATISFYLDDDYNPINSNQTRLFTLDAPDTGSSFVGSATINLELNATNSSPGWHSLLASISAGGQTRYLYAPELVQVLPPSFPPALQITSLTPGHFQITVNANAGQTVVLQSSTNLATWLPLATNTLTSDRWLLTNTPASSTPAQFYRAVVAP